MLYTRKKQKRKTRKRRFNQHKKALAYELDHQSDSDSMPFYKRFNVRSRHQFRYRAVLRFLGLALCFLFALHVWRQHRLARSALEAKYAATSFDEDVHMLSWESIMSHDTASEQRTALLAARSDWHTLGSGWEGTTYTWDDVVIKTFSTGQSPLRNCVPSDLMTNNDLSHRHWPTEIPAVLLMRQKTGFVPLRDVFFASSSPLQNPEWHIVTQFMGGGTLTTLAHNLPQSELSEARFVESLDKRYRPRFEDLLQALQRLHASGFCHDDVKPDNVFVEFGSQSESDGSWLLGDFGNLRHISHPYHASRIWIHNNKNVSNCRAVDALRATKTYLQFLRQASRAQQSAHGTLGFDNALLNAREPWARLLRRALDAGEHLRLADLLHWSHENQPGASLLQGPVPQGRLIGLLKPRKSFDTVGWHRWNERAATALLRISASEGSSRILGLTWLLGVPSQKC